MALGRSRQPTVTALIFVTWVLAAAIAFGPRLLNLDGDPARHLRHGFTILDSGIIRQDPFSFSRPDAPFVGFEYGSQLLLALAHSVAGLAGVAALSALLIASAWALVVRFMLRRGVDPSFAYLTGMASAILGSQHWAARPHLVTFILVAVLLDLLDRERRPHLGFFVLLFALWANLHGGFVYGLILMGVIAAADLVTWWADRGNDQLRQRAREWIPRIALSLAATALTPYGPAVPLHVFGFLGEDFIQRQTTEFFPPDFRNLGPRLFLAVVLFAILALGRSTRRMRLDHLFLVLANLAFALMAQRNIALFAITALPLLAIHFNDAWLRLPEPPNFRRSFAHAQSTGRFWPWAAPAAGLVVILALLRGQVGGVVVMPSTFQDARFPVQAMAAARQAGVEGRMFAEFTWGGYALYAWPEQKIFIDGGTDFFGERLMRDYLDLWTLVPEWRERLEAWRFDFAVVPTDSRLAAALAREPGWRITWCDATAAIIARAHVPDLPAPTGPAPEACTALRAHATGS